MILHIPFFEYQECKFSDLQIPKGVSNPFLDNVFVDGLEKFLQKSGLDNVLSFSRSGIKPASHVGVIKYKNIQFEILPKLLAKNENRDQILKNLLYMLSYTKKLDIKNTKTADLSDCANPFLETLIQVFAKSLFDALKRCAPKGYVVHSENIKFLKGKLNLPDHIKHNFINRSKFFCDFDEFSENNAINQLFLYVATCLYNISRSQQNKKLLKFIINYYADIDFVRFYPRDLTSIKLSRNQYGFAMPLKLAKMFVEETSVDMSKNKFENIALVWDMNVLFEEFVAELLKQHKLDLKIKDIVYQQGRRLLKSDENNKYYSNTFVDIYITMEDGQKLVLDTKYKNNYGKYGEFSNSDIFQVTTYCRLHNAHNAVLLYPATDENMNDIHPYRLNVNKGVDDLHIKTARIDVMSDLSKSTSILVERLRNIL